MNKLKKEYKIVKYCFNVSKIGNMLTMDIIKSMQIIIFKYIVSK